MPINAQLNLKFIDAYSSVVLARLYIYFSLQTAMFQVIDAYSSVVLARLYIYFSLQTAMCQVFVQLCFV